jgi:glycosyltransferase involved in cell wall biosynthesis
MNGNFRISVVIATHNHADLLEVTLSSLAEQRFNCWELLIVNNGSTDHTHAVIQSISQRIALREIHEPLAGKSHALNVALGQNLGEIIVFTDDDILPSSNWLAEIGRAFDSADCHAACGPIVPAFPVSTPGWLREHRYSAFAFGNFNPKLAEGPLPDHLFPFGANFAVRAEDLGELRFREDLGPSGEYPWRMNEDTDFQRRFRARSGGIVFLPGAGVTHRLRPQNIEMSWIFERAFNVGRSFILMDHHLRIEDLIRVDVQGDILDFELGVQLNLYLGQLYQLHMDHDANLRNKLWELIEILPAPFPPKLLAESAGRLMSTMPGVDALIAR